MEMQPKETFWYRYLPMTCVTLIWGLMNVPTAMALFEMPPLELLLLRTAIAAVMLVPLALMKEGTLLPADWSDGITAVLMGITGVAVNNLCFFNAVKNTSLTNIAILFATSPFITLILAALFLKERLTPRRLCGIALALAGVITLLCKGDLTVLKSLSLNKGDLFELGAAFSCSAMAVMGRRIRRTSSIVVTLWNMIPSLGAAAAVIALTGEPMNWSLSGKALFGVAYVGVLSSGCAYILQQVSIQRIGAGRSYAFLNANPAVAIFGACVFMGESVSAVQILSAAVILAGIFLNAGAAKD